MSETKKNVNDHIDLAKLKELAEKASKGEWDAFFSLGSSDLPCSIEHDTGLKETIAEVEVPIRNVICEVNENCDNPTNNFRYIAAANPATILKLLELIEVYESFIMGLGEQDVFLALTERKRILGEE